ncbi:hypothetical protein AJ78_01981 [Emergomyces pasteurianus Ep9510]|uniref:Uncharacterized protein n=1 Tax=Emergomyces pasteurianus Ep9510 TaxID=1447872 RepID=A0A1J9PP62_9EURO|nr:hypothetical protein AJ78_01981 [Emergomyces pasteurianus Ep9510]
MSTEYVLKKPLAPLLGQPAIVVLVAAPCGGVRRIWRAISMSRSSRIELTACSLILRSPQLACGEDGCLSPVDIQEQRGVL